MSRKDFKAIAKIISELREDSLYATFNRDKYKWIDSDRLVFKLGEYFRDQNPRFEFGRFYDACQIREYENDISDSNRSVSSLV